MTTLRPGILLTSLNAHVAVSRIAIRNNRITRRTGCENIVPFLGWTCIALAAQSCFALTKNASSPIPIDGLRI